MKTNVNNPTIQNLMPHIESIRSTGYVGWDRWRSMYLRLSAADRLTMIELYMRLHNSFMAYPRGLIPCYGALRPGDSIIRRLAYYLPAEELQTKYTYRLANL